MSYKDYFSVVLDTLENIFGRYMVLIYSLFLISYFIIPGMSFVIMITFLPALRSISYKNMKEINIIIFILISSFLISIMSSLYYVSLFPDIDYSLFHKIPFISISISCSIVASIFGPIISLVIYFIRSYRTNLENYNNTTILF